MQNLTRTGVFFKKVTFSTRIDQMDTIIHTGIILSVFNEPHTANLVSPFSHGWKNIRVTTGHPHT